MLADMATELDAARMLTLRAASARGTQARIASEAAMAKLFASEAAHRAADKAMQILASAGYRRGSRVERLFRDVRGAELYQGTSEVQRMIIAAHVLESRYDSDTLKLADVLFRLTRRHVDQAEAPPSHVAIADAAGAREPSAPVRPSRSARLRDLCRPGLAQHQNEIGHRLSNEYVASSELALRDSKPRLPRCRRPSGRVSVLAGRPCMPVWRPAFTCAGSSTFSAIRCRRDVAPLPRGRRGV